MSEKEDKNIKDKVEDMTTRNFTISGCPEKVFQRFSSYAKEHAADGYWMAVKQLLDIVDTNAKEVMLYERLMELTDRVNALETKGTEVPKRKPKTFGMNKKDEVEEK